MHKIIEMRTINNDIFAIIFCSFESFFFSYALYVLRLIVVDTLQKNRWIIVIRLHVNWFQYANCHSFRFHFHFVSSFISRCFFIAHSSANSIDLNKVFSVSKSTRTLHRIWYNLHLHSLRLYSMSHCTSSVHFFILFGIFQSKFISLGFFSLAQHSFAIHFLQFQLECKMISHFFFFVSTPCRLNHFICLYRFWTTTDKKRRDKKSIADNERSHCEKCCNKQIGNLQPNDDN